MHNMLQGVSKKIQSNYAIFKIDPAEIDHAAMSKTQRKQVFNQQDPFFKKRIFDKSLDKVLSTDRVQKIIDPFDKNELKKTDHRNIIRNSKSLFNKHCDTDSRFYNNQFRITKEKDVCPNEDLSKLPEKAKQPIRKKITDSEIEKIEAIEQELKKSELLRGVDDDPRVFEDETDKEFNSKFVNLMQKEP